jgi:hypothetical protein
LKIHSPLEESDSLRESVNYRKHDHNTIIAQREITCYDVEKEAYNPRFWTFFHAYWYRSMYQSKKKSVVNMQWIVWDFIQKEKNNCPAFAEVIAACEPHGIKDVMELKYDWNDEVILQFYSTLYLDEKSNKLFWMIDDEIYSVRLVRFIVILGLQDHTRYPKKLHDDRVMELNQMCFMYEKDEYKLPKVEDFKPFFMMHRLLRKTLSPREGDSSRVPQYERNILHVISEKEMFNVFDFIFQEIWNVAVSNNRSCAYAPYIMKMIEKVSKKIFVKNIEHTKLHPNK